MSEECQSYKNVLKHLLYKTKLQKKTKNKQTDKKQQQIINKRLRLSSSNTFKKDIDVDL